MNNQLVEIDKNLLFYNNEEYLITKDNIKRLSLGSKRSLVILGQNLFFKRIKLKSRFNKNEVGYIIERDFGENSNILFHHKKFFLKKEVIIYAIESGKDFNELCRGSNKLKIVPFQIMFLQKFKKKYIYKDWIAILKYRECYYYIHCFNNIIVNNFVTKDILQFKDKCIEANTIADVKVYLDSNLINNLSKIFNGYKILKVGELLHG